MKSKIGEDLGRLFAVGFNIGILAYIEQNEIQHRFGNRYRQDLQRLKFPKILRRLVDKVIDPLERNITENWTAFFLIKGFISGLNFFREYIQSTGWSEPHRLRHLEVVYYQCCFSDDNSLGTYPKGDEQWSREVMSQFTTIDTTDYVRAYLKKGEFLKADTLMLLCHRKKQFRILSVDLSIFSIKTPKNLPNINYIEILRGLLKKDISYLKSKSFFSNLSIDTGLLGLDFSEDLKTYFTAFKYGDKESTKLIQAASYAYSFYQFLQETGILPEQVSVLVNTVGYSDRGISAMSVRPENLDILKTCYQIYKYDSSPQEIDEARRRVLKQIQRNAYRSFDQGRKFVDSLLAIPANKTTLITHQERVSGFYNSIDLVPPELMVQLDLNESCNLRQAHAELIKRSLVSDATYIFLTGNPGIGKTTAIANFLKDHIDEGFLFFYVSPRKQVNLDIIQKFKYSTSDELCHPKLLAINSYSDLIKDNYGNYTVQYFWNERQDNFKEQSVNFLDSRIIERRGRRLNRLNRSTEDVIRDMGQKTKGVLNSICEAIYTIIDRNLSNNIVATVSIQSLKKTDTGDTLKHFEKIFKNAYNERDDKVLSHQMKSISSRIKNLFIMIDEITGDEGGVEFLNGISNIVSKYRLAEPQQGFNTKVIVADASVVDPEVITQHLSNTTSEPHKIYFRHALNSSQPISVQPFKFKNLEAVVINSNSYPARSLGSTYKVVLESCKFVDDTSVKPDFNLDKNLQKEILNDIQLLISRSDVEQIIVYIQNKQRLLELIEFIKEQGQPFEICKDYLEIHANISEVEKEQIQRYQNEVKVIFMTASGSRGLSFPKAKHILVEIPRFEIEQNLMEVIQVIYRGRGQYEEDGIQKTLDTDDKELMFYLADRSVYYDDNPQISLQESVLSLLNILLVLKASVMTRISGSGQIGRQKFLMIPIGGKSVSAAGETFTAQMANLIRELKKEHNRKRNDSRLKEVYTTLEQIMSQADFVLRDPKSSHKATDISYFAAKKLFNNQFSQLVSNGFDELLSLGKLEMGYISGGLLVVPVADKHLEETYEMRLVEILSHITDKLWKTMQDINHSRAYPESLCFAIKDAIELVKKLREPIQKTQWFEQKSQQVDQYYALPLFTFIAGDALNDYFTSEQDEPEDAKFRDILTLYIRTLYPVGDVLPIGHKYQDFPFIVFRSYSLEEIRKKMFTANYILNSHELNVLNLILSKES